MKFDYISPFSDPASPTQVVTIDIESIAENDHILRRIGYAQTFYEAELLEHLGRHGPCGGIYLDVGANIGNHSVFFGKFLADFIVAIEPLARLVPILQRNLASNDVTHSVVISRAVGATLGSGRLVLPEQFVNNVGAHQVVANDALDHWTENDDRDRIEITTVDRIAERLEPYLDGMPITFMKIDAEGMELDVLKGATMVLEDYRPQIAVELPTDGEFAAASSFLATWGYQSIGRFCVTPTYHFINPERHLLRDTPCEPSFR